MLGKKKYYLKNGIKLNQVNIEHGYYGTFFWSTVDKNLYFLLHDTSDQKIEVIKTNDRMLKTIGNSVTHETY